MGTGFHPELTGRENIFLNGAILGMTKMEIRKQFDAIVDFAGVEKFLDTPVKRYSSGMYVRLAFAVAAHLNSEILLVDEVLAVGDAGFQRKCIGTMRSVADAGRTVLLVSHDLGVIRSLASRALRLERGQVMADGRPHAVADRFMSDNTDKVDRNDIAAFRKSQSSDTHIRFESVFCENAQAGEAHYHMQAPITISTTIRASQPTSVCSWILIIKDEFGTAVASACAEDVDEVRALRQGLNEIKIVIKDNPLCPGKYIGDLRIASSFGAITWDWLENLPLFEIVNAGSNSVKVWLDRPGRILIPNIRSTAS